MGNFLNRSKPLPPLRSILAEMPPGEEKHVYVIACQGEHKAICEPFDLLNDTNNQMYCIVFLILIALAYYYYYYYKSKQ
jgi:hypothetical protein